MSIPVESCLIFKAAKGDETAFRLLLAKTAYNKWFGSWSQFSCYCIPPCEKPTPEQFKKLNDRIDVYFTAHPIIKGQYDEGESYESGKKLLPKESNDQCINCGAEKGQCHLPHCEGLL